MPTPISLRDWLSLRHNKAISCRQIKKWYQHHNDIDPLINHIKQNNLANNTNSVDIEKDLEWVEQNDSHHLLCLASPQYPLLLQQIASPPTILYVQGNPNILTNNQLAIIGSRKASPLGISQANTFAKTLSSIGFTITSGMALGIDGAAHSGALSARGSTVAVLGSGFNHIYPKQHRSLAQIISEHGTLLSEFSPNTPPRANHFPQRNRLISGLSLGVLVVEAHRKSGSLITVRHALEQNREVFAIPGSIASQNASGTNYIIQQGAKLVSSIDDILDEFGHYRPQEITIHPTKSTTKLDQRHQNLLECVDFAVTHINDLCKISHLLIKDVAPMLLNLQFHGYIKKVPGGYMRIL